MTKNARAAMRAIPNTWRRYDEPVVDADQGIVTSSAIRGTANRVGARRFRTRDCASTWPGRATARRNTKKASN